MITTVYPMDTKLNKLKLMWAAGDYRGALKLAASWPRLGDDKSVITCGWSALQNEKLYRQMGRDPVALYRAALAAVATRYGLTLPKETNA